MTTPIILYDNIFASGVTATDTDSGAEYSIDNIYDWRGYTYWKAASTGTKNIIMDAGAGTVAVDSLGIYSHNLGTIGASYNVYSSTTGAWAGEETQRIASQSPANDKAIAKTFTSSDDRYWRLQIVTGGGNIAQLGVAVLGNSLEFPDYPDTPFTAASEQTNVTSEVSKGGHLLGSVSYYSPLTINVSFTWSSITFFDGSYRTFWDNHGKLMKPFFWVPNIGTYPTKVYFVRFTQGSSFGFTQSDVTNYDSVSLSFDGVAE